MGVLLSLTKEYFDEDVRGEEGRTIKIEGKKYIVKYSDYPFMRDAMVMDDDENHLIRRDFNFMDEPIYFGIAKDDSGQDLYYYIKESTLKEVKKNIGEFGDAITQWITTDVDLMEVDFEPLKAIYTADLEDTLPIDEGLEIEEGDSSDKWKYKVESDNTSRDIKIYEEDWVRSAAIEESENMLEDTFSDNMDSEEVKRFINVVGDSWIDTDSLKDFFKVDYENYSDDIENENGKHESRLYDEMIEYDIIDDNSNYFNTNHTEPRFDVEDVKKELAEEMMKNDEELSLEEAEKIIEELNDEDLVKYFIDYGVVEDDDEYFELDYSSPKFNISDKKHEFVEKKVDDINDVVDEFISNFGDLDSSYYDLKELAELCVDEDGYGQYLSSYDNKEYKVRITVGEDEEVRIYYLFIN
jgi:hypothetical protein